MPPTVPSENTPAATADVADVGVAKKVVFVAGSGRSGTSTLGGILQQLGLHVPEPEVAADQTNPKGFAESQWVVDYHTWLLGRAHVQVSDARPTAWHDTGRLCARERTRRETAGWLGTHLEQHDELVIKDPRLAWFLGLWRVAAIRNGVNACFATMLRPLPEVIGSKQAYYNKRMNDSHYTAAWVNMMLHTERGTRGSDRVFVRYADLLDDWTATVSQVGEVLDLHGVKTARPESMRKVHNFVDPALRRIRLTWDDIHVPDPLGDLAERTWQQLNGLTEPEGDGPAAHAELDALREAYADYYLACEAVVTSSVVAARGDAAGATPAPGATAPGDASAMPVSPITQLVNHIPHDTRAKVPTAVRRGLRRVVSRREQPR